MKGLDFKPNILSGEYIIEQGVCYNDDFFQDDWQIGPLYDKSPEFGGKPFTGLLYKFYNDTLIYYQFFKDGFAEGEHVRFYKTGELESYCFWKTDSSGKITYASRTYTWFKNGKLKSFREVDEKKKCVNGIRYDERGDIVFLVEDGIAKV